MCYSWLLGPEQCPYDATLHSALNDRPPLLDLSLLISAKRLGRLLLGRRNFKALRCKFVMCIVGSLKLTDAVVPEKIMARSNSGSRFLDR
jgi:hypothetical protein